MQHRRRNQARHLATVDLTCSDDESLGVQPILSSPLVLPEPTQPSRPRRLTVRECLRADQIAYGEIDAPSPSELFQQESSFPSDQDVLGLKNEESPSEVKVQHAAVGPSSSYREPSHANMRLVDRAVPCANESVETLEGSSNANYIEDESPALPVEQLQWDTSPIVVSSSSEAGDSSDDEFVLYGEKDIIDLTKLDDEPEVVEMMANGRPRRTCAPKSFEALIETKGRKLVKRAIEASAVKLTKEERAHADKYRDEIVKIAVAAHHALWENRTVHKFSYNCGMIDVGRARAALIHMGHLIGAHSTVVKKKVSGKCVSYVMMQVGNRLCSPKELDIGEVADNLIDRAFKDTTQRKEAKKKKKSRTDVNGTSKKETRTKRQKKEEKKRKNKGKIMKQAQWAEKMAELEQDVRMDQDAFNRVVPIQMELQGEDTKEETVVKKESVVPRSIAWNRNVMTCGPSQSANILQTSRTQNGDRENERKRKTPLRKDAWQSKEGKRKAWERKRQRKLEGTKIETGNKGFAMLAKMGWSEGQRLGAKKNGISEPIVAEFRTGRRGLGTKK